jgi:hypothetical protein
MESRLVQHERLFLSPTVVALQFLGAISLSERVRCSPGKLSWETTNVIDMFVKMKCMNLLIEHRKEISTGIVRIHM